MRWSISGLWLEVGCGGKDPSKTDSIPTDTATDGTTPTSTGPVDADRDGFPEGEDCDDADPLFYPGAEDPCDGLDQDCDGRDGDPSTPEAWYQQESGAREDLTAALSSGAPISLSDGGTVSVCGGSWDPNLQIDSNLTINASEASFSSALLTITDANVDLFGGVWDGVLDFGGGGKGRLEIELAGGYARAVDGYELTLFRTNLGPGKVYATQAILNVEEAALGGTGGNLIETSYSTVTLREVTITAGGTLPSVNVQWGSLTVEGLHLVDSEAGLSMSSGDATLEGLDVQGGVYPLSFDAASVTLRDSVFRGSEGAVTGSGQLTVENCTFEGIHNRSTVEVQGTLTVRNSNFLGATSSGASTPHQIYHNALSLGEPLLVESCCFADATAAGTALASNGAMTVVDSTFENLDGHGVLSLFTDPFTPLRPSDLLSQVVLERIEVLQLGGALVSGTHCPTLRDFTVTAAEGMQIGFISAETSDIQCQSFGERLEILGDGTSRGLRFEGGEVNFGCVDCWFEDLDGEVIYAPNGDLALLGGRLASNNVYDGAALHVLEGSIRVHNVDLGFGPGENLNASGEPGDDLQVGDQRWDGAAVESILCTPGGCF